MTGTSVASDLEMVAAGETALPHAQYTCVHIHASFDIQVHTYIRVTYRQLIRIAYRQVHVSSTTYTHTYIYIYMYVYASA